MHEQDKFSQPDKNLAAEERPVPSQAEGDRETIEEDLEAKSKKEAAGSSEVLDPNDAERLKNQIRGQTREHANPPRLEDEGQSGG